MKKIFFILIVLLMVGWLSSCSDDPTPPQSPTATRPLGTMDAKGTQPVKARGTDNLSAVGGIISTITVPVLSPGGVGVSVATDCDGNLYYTNSGSPYLYKIDKNGVLLDTKNLVDDAGAPITLGEMAWDGTTGKLWAGTDNAGAQPKVYLIDPATGIATYKFTAVNSGYGFTDGLAYDGTDNTIWLSDDVSTVIEHWDASSLTHLGDLTPTDAGGNPLGSISGVAVGKGDKLYLGQNGLGKIVTVVKSTGAYISDFTTPGGRDEGLECDVVNFPVEVIWSKDAYNNEITAIEVEEGTCACQGDLLKLGMDIKPGSCPNPLNTKDKGVLPVALLGSLTFDVNLIDVSTLRLEGVAPVGSALADVATPYPGDLIDCLSCWTAGADGYTDLTLKFDAQAIVAALGAVTDRECRMLTLTGALLDGTPFVGEDIIRIVYNAKTQAESADVEH